MTGNITFFSKYTNLSGRIRDCTISAKNSSDITATEWFKITAS
jgi:hypothetical protein